MSGDAVRVGECETNDSKVKRMGFIDVVMAKLAKMMKGDVVDEETSRMAERMMLLRISTKHINLWVRQLELKRKAVCELAKLMRFEWIGNEIENEKNLKRWGKRVTNNFPKAMRRKIYEEVDNMVWSENEKRNHSMVQDPQSLR